jgi:hypothetical protein
MKACFRCGIPWRGILHDLSKYYPVEFARSAKYFQGTSSPISAEKTANGYSLAWQHHKGYNKHHWEYWTDFDGEGKLMLLKIPPKYVAEMLCDWAGAGKAYNKGSWTIDTLKTWYYKTKPGRYLHTSTLAYIDMLMANVKDEEDLYTNWIKVSRIEENYALDMLENCDYQAKLEITR